MSLSKSTLFFKEPQLRKNSIMIVSLLLTLFGLFLFVIVYYREEHLSPSGVASEGISLSTAPASISVDEGVSFDVDIILSSDATPITSVDVVLSEYSCVELTAITPFVSETVTSFTTFAPVLTDGSFNETYAIDLKQFGATTYDWDSDTPQPGILGDEILIATLTFIANDVSGSVCSSTLGFEYSYGESTESNTIYLDLTSHEDRLYETSTTSIVINDEPCVPDCDTAECGSDGCGGNCGICEDGYYCKGNTCVASPEQHNTVDGSDRGLFED